MSVTCLPDTLEAPWILSLPSGLKAIGAGDSTLTDMTPGTYSLAWQDIPNYATPAPDTLTTSADSSLAFSGIYDRPPYLTGSVQIDIFPEDATWSIDGSGWYANHGTGDVLLDDIPIGFHRVHFGPYPDHITPYTRNIFVGEGDVVSMTAAYVPEPILEFPDTPSQLMQNFQTVYETRNSEEYKRLMHPDFLTILQQSTTEEFPDVGTTLDFKEESRIHERLFSGSAVTDPNGELVPGVVAIWFDKFQALDAWAASPPDDIIPNAEWAPFEVQFLFDRGQNFSTLKVDGTIKFYVTSRDSLHQGAVRPYYQMVGQVDLTNGGWKSTEENIWGSVKALFR